MIPEQDHTMVELTASIASAYVGHHTLRSTELPEVIQSIHTALSRLGAPEPASEPAVELKPAVPVKKSVTDEYIISLEDGKKFKSMKRYLAGLGMTPDDYRRKWNLPRDYPMVAPSYANRRSELAKASGLGASRHKAAAAAAEAPAPEPEAVAEPAKKGRGRPKKGA